MAALVLVFAGVLCAMALAGCRAPRTQGESGAGGSGAFGSAGQNASVEINVHELRERTAPNHGVTQEVRTVGGADTRGGVGLIVGFGQVEVDFHLPSSLTPADLRAAITTTPAADVYVVDSETLGVTWPGVAVSGMALPDPADLLKEGRAPTGYALEMTLSIDPVKAPVFKDPGGSDAPWTLTIQRRRPPDFSVSCADNPLVNQAHGPGCGGEDPLRGEHL